MEINPKHPHDRGGERDKERENKQLVILIIYTKTNTINVHQFCNVGDKSLVIYAILTRYTMTII